MKCRDRLLIDRVLTAAAAPRIQLREPTPYQSQGRARGARAGVLGLTAPTGQREPPSSRTAAAHRAVDSRGPEPAEACLRTAVFTITRRLCGSTKIDWP